MQQTRTLLVTGGAGFIGSQFVRTALAAGYRIVVLDALTYAGSRDNLREIEGHQGYTFVEGRIEDTTLVKRLLDHHRPEAIINFAAESHVDRSIVDASAFVTTNVGGVQSLLKAAQDYIEQGQGKLRFVQISTDEVFGELGPTGRFNEESPYRPSSPYSASKAAADHLVRAWHRTHGLDTVIVHSTNCYGPRQHREKLIPLMIERCLREEPLPIYGDGSNVREWMHVEDCARGVLLALQKGHSGASYCLASGEERSNLEIVDAICAAMDELRPRACGRSHSELKTFVADRKGHDFRYAVDSGRVRAELGFGAKSTLTKTLNRTVLEFLESSKTYR